MFHTLSRGHGDAVYIIAANAPTESIDAEFVIASDCRFGGAPLEKARQASPSDRQFRGRFDAYGAHVYRVE